MKSKTSKENERIMFFVTMLLLVMAGISLNPSINKALFKENIIQPLIKTEYPQPELFSPEQTIDIVPYALGIIIIVLVILRKEKIITPRKTQKLLHRLNLAKIRFFRRLISKIKELEKMPKIELSKTKNWILNFKPHKKIKKHYIANIYPRVMKELILMRDLFTKPYRPEFTHHFIILFFVVATISMAIFTIIAVPTNEISSEIIEPIKVVYQPSERFSPDMPVNISTLIIGIIILTAVSIIKFRKEKNRI